MDANKDQIIPIFRDTYGPDQVDKWWGYWRIFFMSCAELWGYNDGEEWIVSHYLFEKSNTNRVTSRTKLGKTVITAKQNGVVA